MEAVCRKECLHDIGTGLSLQGCLMAFAFMNINEAVPVSQSKYTRFTLLGTSLQGPGAGSAAGFKQRGVSPPCMGWTRLSLCEPASRASIFNPPDHWLPGSGQVAPYTGSDCTLSRVETSPYSTDR